MRAHYLQHVPFEGLGAIADWLGAAGYTTTVTRFFAADALPDPQDITFLIVMGGPMSVHDEAAYPWLAAEKDFIRSFVATGRPLLGICLGAQLIANALGARVYRNPVQEIGWFPLQATDVADPARFAFPAETTVFHWHGETFDLPLGATRLARSAGCENQAFQFGPSVLGLQFHLETTPESARAIVENCRDELLSAPYVQSEQQILSAPAAHYQAIGGLLHKVLSYLHAGKTAA